MTFHPVGDPVAERDDMAPEGRVEWGEYQVCEPVRQALGEARFDAFYPETFDGTLADPADLHDAAFVEMSAIFAPHLDHLELGCLARRWTEVLALIHSGALPCVTLGLKAIMDDPEDGHSTDRIIVLSARHDEVVLSMFCSCGELAVDPVTYWREDDRLCVGTIEGDDIPPAMRDIDLQQHRWETTRSAVDAARRQAELPAGVVDMAAFAALREARR
jgi:hypothetical protein